MEEDVDVCLLTGLTMDFKSLFDLQETDFTLQESYVTSQKVFLEEWDVDDLPLPANKLRDVVFD